MRNILILLVCCASSNIDLSAQTTSSAAQVVTFGVRRIVLQAPTAMNIATSKSGSPLKVSVGSQSSSHAAVETGTTEKPFSSEDPALTVAGRNPRPVSAAGETNLSSARSPSAKSIHSGKKLVTYTE